MSLKELFIIGRGTRVVFTITISVTAVAIIFAFFYYRGINRSEDPRIEKARVYLTEYERLSGSANSPSFFYLLDSAENIYRSLPDYASSFERGVVYNNRCSGLLLMAIYDTSISENEKKMLLGLSMSYCDSAIVVYKYWLQNWRNLSGEKISSRLLTIMNTDDDDFTGRNYKKIFRRRIKNIEAAQIETPRRLSVSYSNKAAVYRHSLKQDSALFYYRMAISEWKDNRVAKSNLNVLMGDDPIEPKLIEALFPPDRTKE